MCGRFVQAGTAPPSAGRWRGFAATIAQSGAGALAHLLAVEFVILLPSVLSCGVLAGRTIASVGFGDPVVPTAVAETSCVWCPATMVVVNPRLAMFGAPNGAWYCRFLATQADVVFPFILAAGSLLARLVFEAFLACRFARRHRFGIAVGAKRAEAGLFHPLSVLTVGGSVSSVAFV